MTDRRTDSLTGDTSYIVGERQGRPNLPDEGCPFCVGGLEAPEPYEVKAFPNRWPALPDGRAEVVLYSPDHDATLGSLGRAGVRRVIDLWAERTEALNALDDVEYTLIFENCGPEVGATIRHPHGQIYAFDHVPSLPRRELSSGCLDPPGDREIFASGDWRSWVPLAATSPYTIRLAPASPVPDLVSLTSEGRDDMATVLVDAVTRLDCFFERPAPYMMWIHQRPADAAAWERAHVHLEIVCPWRAPGLMRFVAAGELGSGEFFNPVTPEAAAEDLRRAGA